MDNGETSATTRMVRCDEINVGRRFRKDMGDLQALADSIKEVGQLQPIVIDEEGNLICGGRRLLAQRDLLKREEIECRILPGVDSIRAEHDENEIRKAFTASERAEIYAALKHELGSRQGQRTDLAASRDPRIKKGVESRALAARRAGFHSPGTAEQALRVSKKGCAQLIQRLDDESLTADAAALIADEVLERQQEILAMSPQEQKQTVHDMRVRKNSKRSLAKPTGEAPLAVNMDITPPATTVSEAESRTPATPEDVCGTSKNMPLEACPTASEVNGSASKPSNAVEKLLDGIELAARFPKPARDTAAEMISKRDRSSLEISCIKASEFLGSLVNELRRTEEVR